MMNRMIYMSIIAFAATAAVNAPSRAHAETPGYATLSELIHEDLDAAQEDFTLAVVERVGARVNARMARTNTLFGPLTVADDERPQV